MKVGGSCPCFTTMIGVSGSRFPGCVLRYSCTVVAAAFFSSSLACFPIQKKTCGESHHPSVLPHGDQLRHPPCLWALPWPIPDAQLGRPVTTQLMTLSKACFDLDFIIWEMWLVTCCFLDSL